MELRQARLEPLALSVSGLRSSGDTIPNCLGEFREIRESKQRTGMAPYGHPAGTPGATGVQRLRPRENVQRLGGERGDTDRLSATIYWLGDILNMDGPLVEFGLRSFFVNQVVGGRQEPAGDGQRTT
jgi:hypothetical protein